MDWSFDSLNAPLAAGSIVLATIGWLYTAFEQRRLTRRGHTFDVLLSSDITGEFSTLLDDVDNLARIGPPLDPARYDDVDPKVRRSLNFHEFVCAAIRDHTLDEGLIRSTMRTRMLRLYDYSRAFIAELRIRRANPQALEHFEWFAVRRLGYERWKRSLVRAPLQEAG